jgi:hypothetical protein
VDITIDHIVQLYDEIEETDHRYRIRFYESNTSLIFSLDTSQQSYFTFYYICSLFELGKYEHVLAQIDELIEFVFLNNTNYRPVGTFEELLFKKASSLHNTLQFKESIAISVQLIGMHPHETLYQKLTESSYRSWHNWKSSGIRLLAIILIFGSSILSAIFWLLNASYIGHSLVYTFLVVVSPFLLALMILGGSYVLNYARSYWLVRELVLRKRKEKGNQI